MGFLDTFRSPAMVHALVVHAPISLAFLGLPLVLLAAALKERGAEYGGWLSRLTGLVIAAVLTLQTGEEARAPSNAPGVIDEAVWNLVHNHEGMAGKVWIFALVTALLTACTAAQSPRMRVTAGTLAVLAARATAGWIGLTGHYGGTLVYVHGLGTPALQYKQQLIARGRRLPRQPRQRPRFPRPSRRRPHPRRRPRAGRRGPPAGGGGNRVRGAAPPRARGELCPGGDPDSPGALLRMPR